MDPSKAGSADIDVLIAGLEMRKAKLKKLAQLQEEVQAMEVSLFLGVKPGITGARVIVETVCAHYGLAVAALNSDCRESHILTPRHTALCLIRRHTGLSLNAIGRFFKRDHCTVLNAVRTVEGWIETDPKYALIFKQLELACTRKLRGLKNGKDQ